MDYKILRNQIHFELYTSPRLIILYYLNIKFYSFNNYIIFKRIFFCCDPTTFFLKLDILYNEFYFFSFKIQDVIVIKDFRFIVIVNFRSKVIFKILINKFGIVYNRVRFYNQNDFINICRIKNCICIASEIVNILLNYKKKWIQLSFLATENKQSQLVTNTSNKNNIVTNCYRNSDYNII